MFTVDCYTLTGALASIKLSDSWMVQLGVSAGNDQAPWARSAKPNGTALLRWQARNNKDMIYGGVNTIGNGQYSMSGQHDNLQQFNLTCSIASTEDSILLPNSIGFTNSMPCEVGRSIMVPLQF